MRETVVEETDWFRNFADQTEDKFAELLLVVDVTEEPAVIHIVKVVEIF